MKEERGKSILTFVTGPTWVANTVIGSFLLKLFT
jgi:hypothetical protein